MNKPSILFIILMVILVAISGCTEMYSTNGTFGDKQVSVENITVYNVTGEHLLYNDTNYYIIKGNLVNNNQYDAFKVKMRAVAYDSRNRVVAINDSVYVNPRVLPAASNTTFFGIRFIDNQNRIVKFDLQIVSVDAKP